jgi:peptide/nickel transport system ATP-binding protein
MTELIQLRPDALLSAERLVQRFRVPGGQLEAVSDVSFDVRRGETLGLVGESGCGKSSTGRAVLQLPRPTSGTVRFDGQDLTAVSGDALRRVRAKLQVIFQDPTSALNPRRRVRDIVGEGLMINDVHRAEIERRVDEALVRVGLEPDAVGDRRPHQFSGGQCQRIAIARAMVLQPQVIICDEPVASLDVSIQGQVLNLLERMRGEDGLSLVFISHDLHVVRAICDRIAVMYLGKIVEIGDSESIYEHPKHPYTAALLSAIPEPDPRARRRASRTVRAPAVPPVNGNIARPAREVRQRVVLQGEVANPAAPPSGCYFHPRCQYAIDVCTTVKPTWEEIEPGHFVRCHRSRELQLPGVSGPVEP